MSVVCEIDNTDGFGGTEIHRIVFDIAIDELGAFHAVSVAGGQHITDREKNAAAIQLKILLFMFSSIYASTAGG